MTTPVLPEEYGLLLSSTNGARPWFLFENLHYPGDDKPRLRVCGDYSVTVNPQLAVHRHPFTTARGTDEKAWRRLRLYENRFGRRLQSSPTWSREPQAFGSQYAQRCSVTKCSSLWNFHQLQVTSRRSWMTSLLIFLALRFI